MTETGNGQEPNVKPQLTKEMRQYLSTIGKLGGRKGGLQRAINLSPERRKEIAAMALKARHKNLQSRKEHILATYKPQAKAGFMV